MLQGVEVDDLTGHFLAVAADGDRSRDLSQSLRVFFHDVRNSLNALKIGLYIARRGVAGRVATWDELDQSYRGLEQLIDRLQTICRPIELSPITGDIGPWLEESRPSWTSRLAAIGRRLDWSPPPAPAIGRFDPRRLIQALDALVAWRAGEGGSDEPARLAWSGDAERLHIEWSEDGPAPAEPLEGRDCRPITMALPLLAHVMTAHGGSLAVSRRGGLVVRLSWPTANVEAGPP